MAYDFPREAQTWLCLAFFASFAVKMPMWPVHTWLPDAHVQAPTAGSVILAGVLLKMGGYGFIRFSLPMFPEGSAQFIPLIFVLSGIAVVYTSLVALVQRDMKKLIAYSSVAHMAFVTFGLFAFNRQGIEGAMIVMLGHGLVSGALFLCVGVIYDRLHTREIDRYGGLADNMPGYALLFMLFTMASVGLPGTSNFVGEFLSLVGTYRASSWAAIVATTGIILGAAYMLYLYWRIVLRRGAHADAAAMPDLDAREWWLLAPIAAAVLWMGVYPESFLRPMRNDVGRLLARARARRAGGRLARSTLGKGASHQAVTTAIMRERRTDGPVRTHPSRTDPVGRRHRPDDGRCVRRAARDRPRQLACGRLPAWRDRRADRRALARRARVRRTHSGRPVRELRQGDHLPRRGGRDHRRARLVRARAPSMAPNMPVLILFSAVGMSVMVSATSLITLYVGLELQSLAAYVLASYRRTDERSAEAGLKYFVLGALASGILLYGISLLYGFTGTTNFTGIAAAFGRGAPSARPAVRPRLRARRPRLQGQRGAVPHVDARRLRRRADAGHRLLRSAPKVAAVLLATRVCLEALGPATDAWRQIVIFAALASIFLGAVARLRADQHQAAARLFVDQQCRLRADRPCRRRVRAARRRCCSTWRSMS